MRKLNSSVLGYVVPIICELQFIMYFSISILFHVVFYFIGSVSVSLGLV